MNRLSAVILILALFTACAKEQNVVEEPLVETADVESCLIPGEVILQLSEDMTEAIESGGVEATKSSGLSSALDALGVMKFERLYPDAGKWEPRHRAAGLHRWYRVTYDSSKEPVTKAQTRFEDINGVVSVGAARKVKSSACFNDPYFAKQWHFYNDGSLGSEYVAGADINVVPVWRNYTAGSNDVIVAVVDEGVDLQHEDLAANCISASESGSKCFLDDYEGFTIYPGDHGTHVAGIIAAVNDNGKGVCGIAGGDGTHPGVRIMSCQILRENPKTGKTDQGNSCDALVWAADHGAIIAQNSWEYVYATEEDAAAGDAGAFAASVDYFNKYAGCDENGNQLADSPMKGGIVIFAAGNESRKHAWPPEYEGVMAVGSISSTMGKAYYSNYGDWVDICAPGGDSKVGPTVISCLAGNGYGGMQGTSMACPHVSGVAALVLSYFGGPGFTREMLWERLVDGANPNQLLVQQKIGPLVDALGAFSYGGTIAPDKVSDVSTSVKSNSVTLSWKVTADEDAVKAYAYLLMLSKDKADLESLDPKALPSSVRTAIVETGDLGVGDDINAEVSDLEFDTDYWCSVMAFDYTRNYSESSPLKKVHTGKNNAPVVETDYDGDYRIKTFETLSVTFRISDPDGHSFAVETEPGSTAAEFETSDDSCQLTVVGSKADPGTYTAHIVVTDKYYAQTDYPVNYTILENHPPKVISQIDNILLGALGETQTLEASDYFYDEDGESLKYAVGYSSQNVAQCVETQGKIDITSVGYGLTDVTLTATDAAGKCCSTTFKVAVRDPSVPVSLYPNPVSTVLNVSTADEASAEIRIVSKAGATVREVKQTVSPFEPAVIDMNDCPAGVYSVVFKSASVDGRYTIVKK